MPDRTNNPSPAPIRIERDSMGELAVPADALYAAQTQRALDNFHISGTRLPLRFIDALLRIKQAAAKVNADLGVLDADIAQAIDGAVAQLLALPPDARMAHFPLDVYQTGSGTSTNMNANEVIATLATRALGKPVDANDHVNASQSSNDCVPTALHLSAALALHEALLPALDHLAATTRAKARSVDGFVKTGRTHLMDAMPVRMGQAVDGWAAQIEAAAGFLRGMQPALHRLAQGGTAVGTGVNAPAQFAQRFADELGKRCGLPLAPAPDYFAAMGAQDTAVALSGQLKTLAVALMKISNDLRWMNSGPLAGLGEIELLALQPGSSIMPGKVNPVIPEACAMVAAQVIGFDAAITVAGQSGNFELNVMLPLIANDLLQGIELLANASRALADHANATFKVKPERLAEALARNPILVTALNPLIGYAKAAEIAKQAYREGRPVIDVADEHTDLGRERLAELLDPRKLTGA